MDWTPYNVHTATASFYVTTEYKILPGMDYQNPDYTNAVLSSYSNLLTEHQTIGALARKIRFGRTLYARTDLCFSK